MKHELEPYVAQATADALVNWGIKPVNMAGDAQFMEAFKALAPQLACVDLIDSLSNPELKGKLNLITADLRNFDSVPKDSEFEQSESHWRRNAVNYPSDYFPLKALDMLADGGVMAVVVDWAFLTKTSPFSRMEMVRRADLISVHSLSFATVDNPMVSTELLVMQRHDGKLNLNPDEENFTQARTLENGAEVNRYLQAHSEAHIYPYVVTTPGVNDMRTQLQQGLETKLFQGFNLNLFEKNNSPLSPMAKEEKAEKTEPKKIVETPLMKQFDEMKKKHPDAILLFRVGDFYETFRQDAVDASKILDITLTRRAAGTNKSIELAGFPHHALDVYLPKLVRAGRRVAICEQLENPALKKRTQPTEMVTPGKKKEEKTEAKAEKTKREPQMVTVNGDKVSHAHVYKVADNDGKDKWFFTAKLNGEPLRPQRMTQQEVDKYMDKDTRLSISEYMNRYYPTKVMPKVDPELFRMPATLKTPEKDMAIEKFNVYKERNQESPNFGKWMFYGCVDGQKMSALGTTETLNAYFDRVATPQDLVKKLFGDRLHLASFYEQFKLPEGVTAENVRIAKSKETGSWFVYVDLGPKGETSKALINYNDGFSYFRAKTATAEQIAAKYLGGEMTRMVAEQKQEQKSTLKI